MAKTLSVIKGENELKYSLFKYIQEYDDSNRSKNLWLFLYFNFNLIIIFKNFIILIYL